VLISFDLVTAEHDCICASCLLKLQQISTFLIYLIRYFWKIMTKLIMSAIDDFFCFATFCFILSVDLLF